MSLVVSGLRHNWNTTQQHLQQSLLYNLRSETQLKHHTATFTTVSLVRSQVWDTTETPHSNIYNSLSCTISGLRHNWNTTQQHLQQSLLYNLRSETQLKHHTATFATVSLILSQVWDTTETPHSNICNSLSCTISGLRHNWNTTQQHLQQSLLYNLRSETQLKHHTATFTTVSLVQSQVWDTTETPHSNIYNSLSCSLRSETQLKHHTATFTTVSLVVSGLRHNWNTTQQHLQQSLLYNLRSETQLKHHTATFTTVSLVRSQVWDTTETPHSNIYNSLSCTISGLRHNWNTTQQRLQQSLLYNLRSETQLKHHTHQQVCTCARMRDNWPVFGVCESHEGKVIASERRLWLRGTCFLQTQQTSVNNNMLWGRQQPLLSTGQNNQKFHTCTPHHHMIVNTELSHSF